MGCSRRIVRTRRYGENRWHGLNTAGVAPYPDLCRSWFRFARVMGHCRSAARGLGAWLSRIWRGPQLVSSPKKIGSSPHAKRPWGTPGLRHDLGNARLCHGNWGHSGDVPTRSFSVSTRFEFESSTLMATLLFLGSFCELDLFSSARFERVLADLLSGKPRNLMCDLFQARLISAQGCAAMARCRTRKCTVLIGPSEAHAAHRRGGRRSVGAGHQPLGRDELESVVRQPSSAVSRKVPLMHLSTDTRLKR
jgi:hypothetical protein